MALMSIKNLTIAVREDGFSIIIDHINNKLTGFLGRILDRLYVHKNRRDCILKSTEHYEDNDDNINKNLSFFYLTRHNLVDINYLSFERKYNFDYLENTKTILITQHQLGQFLFKPKKFQQTDLSSFLFNNLNSLFIILIGYLLISLLNLMFIKLIDCKRIKILNVKFYNLLSLNYNQLCFLSFKFGLVNLFFNLFLFINLSLLTNTIKTDKVIVKTDEFLNSDHKLLRTDKKLVFSYNDEEKYGLSSNESLIGKLYQKKVHIEKNYFKISSNLKKNEYGNLFQRLASFFVIGDIISSLYYFSTLSSYSKNGEFLYIDNQNYFEIHYSYQLRKSLNKEIKKMIHRSTNQYFENGIYLELMYNVKNEFYKFIIDNGVPIIFNLNDYIDQQTIISSFALENFKNIFILFIVILIVIFLVFIVNLTYKKIKFIFKIQFNVIVKFLNFNYQIFLKFLINLKKKSSNNK